MRYEFYVLLLAVLVICCGCAGDPTPKETLPALKPPETAKELDAVKAELGSAGQAIEGAANDIKVTSARQNGKFTWEDIGKPMLVITENAGVVQKQADAITRIQQAAIDAEALAKAQLDQLKSEIAALAEKYEKLVKQRDALQKQMESAQGMRWLITAGIVVMAVGGGIGFWLKNARLSVASWIAGGIAAVAAVVIGAFFKWAMIVAIGLAVLVLVAALVVGIALFIDWRKHGLNALREKDVLPAETKART